MGNIICVKMFCEDEDEDEEEEESSDSILSFSSMSDAISLSPSVMYKRDN